MSEIRKHPGSAADPDSAADPGSAAGPDWETAFEDLRAAYRRKLREQLAVLQADLQEAGEPPHARAALDAALRLAHRMKGTAGCYAFDESAAALEQLEARLEELARGIRGEAVWSEIERLLERARVGVG